MEINENKQNHLDELLIEDASNDKTIDEMLAFDEGEVSDTIKEEFKKYSEDAEDILSDETKTRQFITKVQKVLNKAKKVPVLGSVVKELVLMLDLLCDYVDGKYKEVPTNIIVAIVAALAYFISPIDIIPDTTPGIRYLDDLAFIKIALVFGGARELKKYEEWKNNI